MFYSLRGAYQRSVRGWQHNGMVERLLVFLSAIVVIVLGFEDVRTKQPLAKRAPQLMGKGTQQVTSTSPVILPGTQTSYDIRFPVYLHQDKDGSLTPPVNYAFSKEGQKHIPLGVSRGLLDQSCLQLLRCQNENEFFYNYMEIHHADLPEQSAAACGHLCMRQRPGSRLVMAKMNPVSDRLVCGCGDQEALPRLPASRDAQECSQLCPEGGHSCGGPGLVSVYQIDRDRKECMTPIYFYHGCHHGQVGQVAFTLHPWERWPGGCWARCQEPTTSSAFMRLTSTANGTTWCECWLAEAEVGSPVKLEEGQECGWRCRDGEGWCGDAAAGLTGVYEHHTAAGVRQDPPSLSFFLLTLVLGSFPMCCWLNLQKHL